MAEEKDEENESLEDLVKGVRKLIGHLTISAGIVCSGIERMHTSQALLNATHSLATLEEVRLRAAGQS